MTQERIDLPRRRMREARSVRLRKLAHRQLQRAKTPLPAPSFDLLAAGVASVAALLWGFVKSL